MEFLNYLEVKISKELKGENRKRFNVILVFLFNVLV